MAITSKSNPLIKEISTLSDKKYRREFNKYIVEGTKPVNECLAAECEVEKIICSEELASAYPNAVVVSNEVFQYISSEKTPQGVMAVIKLPQIAPIAPQGSCILLDGIQDPGNLGTIIRTANAAGYNEIYLLDCTDAFSPKAVRASMSGIFFVKVYRCSRNEIFSLLKDVPLICADMDGDNIFEFDPPDKYCLCIGNEGNGIGDDIIDHSKYRIRIPMSDTCESLNAAVSAGIAMYQLKSKSKR